jgi:hypothetical protein
MILALIGVLGFTLVLAVMRHGMTPDRATAPIRVDRRPRR